MSTAIGPDRTTGMEIGTGRDDSSTAGRERTGARAAGAKGTRAIAVAVLATAVGLSAAWIGARAASAAGLNLSRGTQGYLGVDVRDVADDQVSTLKLRETRGAEVVRVDHDGPAGKIGLREHDVILQMNGEVIQGQEQLRRMLHETPAGRSVTLIISRDGQQQTVHTQLANREEVERQAWEQHLTVPEPQGPADALSVDPGPVTSGGPNGRVGGGPGAPGSMGFLPPAGGGSRHSHNLLSSMMGAPYTGAQVEPVGAQLAQFFGVSDGTGLLVQNVDANSPAATAGLRAGDLVLKADQTALSSPGDWARAMHGSKGKPVALLVLRDKKQQTLSLTPDAKRRSAMQWPFDPGFAELPGLSSDTLVASVEPLPPADLHSLLAEAQAAQGIKLDDLPKADDLRKLLDDAQAVAAQVQPLELQSMVNGDALNSADLGRMEAEIKRAMPGELHLQQQLDGLGQDLGRDGRLQEQLKSLREQMERTMPGSMD